MPDSKHFIIIIPGLGDRKDGYTFLTRHWKDYGLNVIVYPFGWRDEVSFLKKLENLIVLIDKLSTKGKVSIVGASAGGSAAINAFSARSNKVYKIVNVCGRLRQGQQTGYRGFISRTQSSDSFRDSVLQCEKNIKTLSIAQRKKILTLHAKFGDELVPADTTIIEGATNISLPYFEHLITINLAMYFPKKIAKFLK